MKNVPTFFKYSWFILLAASKADEDSDVDEEFHAFAQPDPPATQTHTELEGYNCSVFCFNSPVLMFIIGY
jgi:hypothetical protein